MSKWVLTTFKKSFESTISNAFLSGTVVSIDNVIQDKNVNYLRGITPTHDGWGLIDDANSFFAIVAPRDIEFHEQPTAFCTFKECEIAALGSSIAEHYSDAFTNISPKWAYYWALRIGNREVMRKVILNSRSNFYSKCWINNIDPTDRELIALNVSK